MNRHLEINKWWKGDCKQNNLLPVRAVKLKVNVSCLKDTGHRKPSRILEVLYNSHSVSLFLSHQCKHASTVLLSTRHVVYLYTTFLCTMQFLICLLYHFLMPHWSKAYPFFRGWLKNPTFLRNSNAHSSPIFLHV